MSTAATTATTAMMMGVMLRALACGVTGQAISPHGHASFMAQTMAGGELKIKLLQTPNPAIISKTCL